MLIKNLIFEKGINPYNILYLNIDIHELDFIDSDKTLSDVIDIYKQQLNPKVSFFCFILTNIFNTLTEIIKQLFIFYQCVSNLLLYFQSIMYLSYECKFL